MAGSLKRSAVLLQSLHHSGAPKLSFSVRFQRRPQDFVRTALSSQTQPQSFSLRRKEKRHYVTLYSRQYKYYEIFITTCFVYFIQAPCIVTYKYYEIVTTMGAAVAQWLRCCATNRKVAGSIPDCVNGFFIDIKFFRSHYGPGVDSAPNRNEYQEHFLGVKATGA